MNPQSDPLDWSLLFRAFNDASEWVLDVAAHTARNYPDEVATVERVRKFMRARNAGRPAHLRFDDLLFTFALVLAAIERDLGPLTKRPPTFTREASWHRRSPSLHGSVRSSRSKSARRIVVTSSKFPTGTKTSFVGPAPTQTT